MLRRSAIEPAISHLKHEHSLNSNRLKGMLGDCMNALLSAAGMNFHKLLRCIAAFLRFIVDRIYDILQPYLLAENAQI